MVHCWPQLAFVVHLSSSTVSYTVEKAKWFLVEQTIVAGGLLLVFPPRPKKRELTLGERSSTRRNIFSKLLLPGKSVTSKKWRNHHSEEREASLTDWKRPDCLTS